MDREKRLLSEMAVVAGRINKHKAAQKRHESDLLAKVSRLSGLINRYKNTSDNTMEDSKDTSQSQDITQSRLKTPRDERSDNGVPKMRFSRLSKPALKKKKMADKRSRKVAKKRELCVFYTQLGKCHNYSKCPYVHDPKKVALCHAFLRGECKDAHCTLQHSNEKLAHRMPACYYFNRGNCLAERCIYAHVHVNENAPVCEDFKKGFCPRGPTCQQQHTLSKKHDGKAKGPAPPQDKRALEAYNLLPMVKISPKLRSQVTPSFALEQGELG